MAFVPGRVPGGLYSRAAPGGKVGGGGISWNADPGRGRLAPTASTQSYPGDTRQQLNERREIFREGCGDVFVYSHLHFIHTAHPQSTDIQTMNKRTWV